MPAAKWERGTGIFLLTGSVHGSGICWLIMEWFRSGGDRGVSWYIAMDRWCGRQTRMLSNGREGYVSKYGTRICARAKKLVSVFR